MIKEVRWKHTNIVTNLFLVIPVKPIIGEALKHKWLHLTFTQLSRWWLWHLQNTSHTHWQHSQSYTRTAFLKTVSKQKVEQHLTWQVNSLQQDSSWQWLDPYIRTLPTGYRQAGSLSVPQYIVPDIENICFLTFLICHTKCMKFWHYWIAK